MRRLVTNQSAIPPGVVVIGMHRSGTSATVLTLEKLGLNLCLNTDRLKNGPGDPNNPDHGESKSIIIENEKILHLLNSDWDRPQLPARWATNPLITQLTSQANTIFRRVYPKRPWAWKEPRLSLTLPFWEKSLETKLPVVFVFRHPLEVAQSLVSRENSPAMTMEHATALWERYNRVAMREIRHHSVFCLDYADLLKQPEKLERAIREWLISENIVFEPIDKQTAIKAKLYHQVANNTQNKLTSEQRKLYQQLVRLKGIHKNWRHKPIGQQSALTKRLFGPENTSFAGENEIIAQEQLVKRITVGSVVFGLLAISLYLYLSRVLFVHPITRFDITSGGAANTPSYRLAKVIWFITKWSVIWKIILVTAVALLANRRYMAGTVLGLSLALSMAVEIVLRKYIPYLSGQPALFSDYHLAFPATGLLVTTAAFGLLAFMATRKSDSPRAKWIIVSSYVCLLVLASTTRIYLQTRFTTNVIGSLLLGFMLAIICIIIVEISTTLFRRSTFED